MTKQYRDELRILKKHMRVLDQQAAGAVKVHDGRVRDAHSCLNKALRCVDKARAKVRRRILIVEGRLS